MKLAEISVPLPLYRIESDVTYHTERKPSLRRFGCHHHKAFVLRYRMIRQSIEAAPHPVQQTSVDQTRQDDPGRTDGIQIDGAQQPLLAGQIDDALGMGVGGHGW